MNREEFVQRGGRRFHDFDVPGFGPVRIRSLSAGDIHAVAKSQDDEKENWELLIRSIVKEDGSPVFGADDHAAVAGLDFYVVNAVAEQVRRFNRLGESVENGVKNS